MWWRGRRREKGGEREGGGGGGRWMVERRGTRGKKREADEILGNTEKVSIVILVRG